MEVILAESAGFCFGVKRAVEKVYEQAAIGKKIYTFGPIIHNEGYGGKLLCGGVLNVSGGFFGRTERGGFSRYLLKG